MVIFLKKESISTKNCANNVQAEVQFVSKCKRIEWQWWTVHTEIAYWELIFKGRARIAIDVVLSMTFFAWMHGHFRHFGVCYFNETNYFHSPNLFTKYRGIENRLLELHFLRREIAIIVFMYVKGMWETLLGLRLRFPYRNTREPV